MDQLDLNKLWQNFTDTIAKHYVDFDGRVGRSQFWWYIVIYAAVAILIGIVSSITFTGNGLRSLYWLALLLPTLGITSRRLHDMGRTASWVLLLAVPWILTIILGLVSFLSFVTFGLLNVLMGFWPIVGLVWLAANAVLIYFCAQPGTPGPNEYGAEPAAWTPNGTPAAPMAPPPPAAS